MKIRAEEIVGLAVIGGLLLWIWSHKQAQIIEADNVVVPQQQQTPMRGNIYSAPPAPDLNNYSRQLNQPMSINLINKTAANPAPCACGCDDGGASGQITQSLLNFTDGLTKKMGAAYDSYIENIKTALPPYYQQFVNNPDAAAASALLKKQLSEPQHALSTDVLGVKYPGDSQIYGAYNGNTFSPGREVAFATTMTTAAQTRTLQYAQQPGRGYVSAQLQVFGGG